MADAKTFTGGCHCGAVRYEVTGSLDKVISCNCSICEKRGLLLIFAAADQFKLLSGADKLADYQFNKKVIHHNSAANAASNPSRTAPRPAPARWWQSTSVASTASTSAR